MLIINWELNRVRSPLHYDKILDFSGHFISGKAQNNSLVWDTSTEKHLEGIISRAGLKVDHRVDHMTNYPTTLSSVTQNMT